MTIPGKLEVSETSLYTAVSGSRRTLEEVPFLDQVRPPFKLRDLPETEVGDERLAHGLHEPLLDRRVKTLLPVEAEHPNPILAPFNPWLNPPHQSIAE